MTRPVAVLIADDDLLVCESVCAWLEDDGFTVYVATGGQEALQILAVMPIDLALVDLKLPDMTGETFLQQALTRYPDSRFVIHTGSHSYRLSAELLELGMRDDDIVCKPVMSLDHFSGLIRGKVRGGSAVTG